MTARASFSIERRPGASVIGIDIGGTKIASGLVDLKTGTASHVLRTATDTTRSGKAVLATVRTELARLMETANGLGMPVACAGVGVPELVDAQGRVFSGYRVKWNDLDVEGELSDIVATRIESDVRAAALAEARYGAGRPFRQFIYLSIGTGISAVLVNDGQPYLGARGAALVLANGVTTFTCPECGTHSRYILEDYASGPGLAQRYANATAGADTSTAQLLQMAQNGDRIAVAIVDSAADALGNAIGLLVGVLDPQAIVVGGGLGSGSAYYRDLIAAAVRRRLWQDDARALSILAAELGADAGMIGAAAFAADRTALHEDYPNQSEEVRRHATGRA